jgi:hypothetical protein
MERINQGNDRTEELNNRISRRNIPSDNLQPQFGIRPLSTKYSTMQIVDRREFPSVPIQQTPLYNTENVFNPGTSQAPWGGFATNINKESQLRNQFFALQRNTCHSAYIPSKDSDMYVASVTKTEGGQLQPFPYLFEKETFESFNPCPKNVGDNLFENCTRQQMKDT